MLAEDARVPGQIQRTLLLTAQVAHASCLRCCSCPPSPTEATWSSLGACHTPSGSGLPLRNLQQREPEFLSWTTSRPAQTLHCLHLPRLFALPVSLERCSGTKAIGASVHKTCGERAATSSGGPLRGPSSPSAESMGFTRHPPLRK